MFTSVQRLAACQCNRWVGLPLPMLLLVLLVLMQQLQLLLRRLPWTRLPHDLPQPVVPDKATSCACCCQRG